MHFYNFLQKNIEMIASSTSMCLSTPVKIMYCDNNDLRGNKNDALVTTNNYEMFHAKKSNNLCINWCVKIKYDKI